MKLKVLKPFALGGKEYLEGTADVPDEKVEGLLKKGLIRLPGSSDAEGEGNGEDQSRALVGDVNDPLEPIASRLSASFGAARHSGETPLQFLERFADEARDKADEAEQRLKARLDEQARQFDAAYGQLQGERDQVVAERDQAFAENDKLRTELDSLKADANASAEDNANAGGEGEKPKPDGKGKK